MVNFGTLRTAYVWPWLTAHVQTELAINTNVVVSDVHRGVVNTHTIVSEIHRTIVQKQEGTDGKNQSVSVVCTPFIIELTSLSPRLK